MKGELGVCSSDKTGFSIRRTKFDTEKNAKNALDIYINLEVMTNENVVYKCKLCKTFHFGKQEWKEKFGYEHVCTI